MPLFFIRRLVLLLFLAVLAPAQALASDSQASLVSFDISGISSTIESEQSPRQEIPASSSHAQHNTLAIVQNQRSISVPKQELDRNDLSRNTSSPSQCCTNNTTYAVNVKWLANSTVFEHESAYRLGGWKDSNALYVALNSQFTS